MHICIERSLTILILHVNIPSFTLSLSKGLLLFPPIFMSSDRSSFTGQTPIRISFHVESLQMGEDVLEHLTEQQLIAGGTAIEARSVNWVGGRVQKEERIVVSGYTTAGKLPIIRGRIETLYDNPPEIAQYVMTDANPAVEGWIERNVQK